MKSAVRLGRPILLPCVPGVRSSGPNQRAWQQPGWPPINDLSLNKTLTLTSRRTSRPPFICWRPFCQASSCRGNFGRDSPHIDRLRFPTVISFSNQPDELMRRVVKVLRTGAFLWQVNDEPICNGTNGIREATEELGMAKIASNHERPEREGSTFGLRGSEGNSAL